MSAINHFQTYSQRENHVTNNTMLMLRHVYRSSPKLLEDVLQYLLEEDDLEIGPRFEQQTGASNSIFDAAVIQKPLHVYIETKHGDGLYDDQIKRHICSIEKKNLPANSAFLIGLTVNNPDQAERWREKARVAGITFIATTFRDLLEALDTACSKDPSLREVLEDFQTFIGSENLLPDQYRKLVAMLCGQSWNENIQHGAYFEPAYRNPKWTRAHFLGIYRQKRISHVGRMIAAAVCLKNESGKLIVESEEFGTLGPEHKDRILAIMGDADAYYEGFAFEAHRYYLAPIIHELMAGRSWRTDLAA